MRLRIRPMRDTRGRRLLCIGFTVGMLAVPPALASARSRFAITPPQPSANSTITVSFKIPRRLPKGRHWILSIEDFLRTGQSCATFDTRDFATRGRRGQILKATFTPRQDFLDKNPTAWCTGSTLASGWAAFAESDTIYDLTRKYFHVVGIRPFTIA
jgi:hypothetical protein